MNEEMKFYCDCDWISRVCYEEVTNYYIIHYYELNEFIFKCFCKNHKILNFNLFEQILEITKEKYMKYKVIK